MANKVKIPTPQSLAAKVYGAASRSSDPPVTSIEDWSDWVPLQSSNVAAVRYNSAESQLEVAFRSGGTYRYPSVPETTYLAFLSAPSPGRFVNANIKPAFKGYRVRRSS